MTVNKNSLSTAKQILSEKNSGPSGVLAYMWANAHEVVDVHPDDGKSYSFDRPFVDSNTQPPLQAYFTIVETDRSGLTVVAPPGGTQDVLFDLDGKPQFAELAKPKKQQELITQLTGNNVDKINDELFVAHLLQSDSVTNVQLESAFDAAVRETAEEHGWDYQRAKSISRRVFDVEETLFSKRSFETDPPTPILQNVFVVEVDDFEGVIPGYTGKIETKIPSMMGNNFYEKGGFMSLPEIEDSLTEAKTRLDRGDLSKVADHDYQAAKSRFQMMQRIEAQIRVIS